MKTMFQLQSRGFTANYSIKERPELNERLKALQEKTGIQFKSAKEILEYLITSAISDENTESSTDTEENATNEIPVNSFEITPLLPTLNECREFSLFEDSENSTNEEFLGEVVDMFPAVYRRAENLNEQVDRLKEADQDPESITIDSILSSVITYRTNHNLSDDLPVIDIVKQSLSQAPSQEILENQFIISMDEKQLQIIEAIQRNRSKKYGVTEPYSELANKMIFHDGNITDSSGYFYTGLSWLKKHLKN